MKAKDIVVGEDYAIRWRTRYDGTVVCRRAKVVAVGKVERRVFSGSRWDFSGHTSTGICATIEQTPEDRRNMPLTDLTDAHVALTQVVEPWADYAARTVIREEQVEGLRERLAAVKEGFKGLGVDINFSEWEGKVSPATLGLEEAEKLLRMVEEAKEEARMEAVEEWRAKQKGWD